MSKENQVNLTKQTLPQLKELLERQDLLLLNKRLLQTLNDKGESVRQFRSKLEQEITHRKNMEGIQQSLSIITVSGSTGSEFINEKHVGYVCSKDKPIYDVRYRPHRTLVSHGKTQSKQERSPKKDVEITAALEPKLIHEPTKFIPLRESLLIENEQVLRVMEERARRTFHSLNDLSSDSESEGSGIEIDTVKKNDPDDE